jgi:hypothetical protein
MVTEQDAGKVKVKVKVKLKVKVKVKTGEVVHDGFHTCKLQLTFGHSRLPCVLVGSVQRFRNEVSHESIVRRESDKMRLHLRLHLRLDVRFRYWLRERGLVCSASYPRAQTIDDHKDRAIKSASGMRLCG